MFKIKDDSVEVSIEVSAGIDKVWDALTRPEKIQEWFASKGVKGKIEVGEEALLCFGSSDPEKEGPKCRIRIEALDRPNLFAFRWVPAEDSESPLDMNRTVVASFSLEPTEQGTRVTVKESGYAALPPEVRKKAFYYNSDGWDEMLDVFGAYVDPRFSPSTKDRMKFRTDIKAPGDRVWRVFTDPDLLPKAIGAKGFEGAIAPNTDGFIVFGNERSRVRYVEVRPESLLSFRWKPGEISEAPIQTETSTLVTIHLLPWENRTFVHLTEEGFAELDPAHREQAFTQNEQGWRTGVLPAIKAFIEASSDL
jgi:uncharacterized protein YndB with AHSA1/START domain